MSWEAAATLPAAFMTAVYALEAVARLSKGERVLIHAATGGVGLAALQVAKAHGAEIFATAGTIEKRERLKSLGVTNVFDSRTPTFAEEIRARTGGSGIDVVLNSLTGDMLVESLRLVAPGGRFVELGKREILSAEQLTRFGLAHGAVYLQVDLTTVMLDEPEAYGRLLADVIARITAGEFQPLPSTKFSASEAGPAFDLMIRAQHIGKIVLDFEHRAPLAWFVEPGHAFRHSDDRFTVRPTQAADYRALRAALGPAVGDIRQILHVWNADPPSRGRTVDAQLERSFFGPLRMVQELGREDLQQRVNITMVSTGVHRIAGESTVDPVKATLLGPSRVMQRELPNLACRHIDLEPSINPWQQRRCVQQVAGEMRAPVHDRTIAFRGSDRWIQSFSRAPLEASINPGLSNDAYLITGGLGGLGLAIAERLAAQGAKKIALVGRNALPERREWNHILTTDPDGAGRRVWSVLACESHGAELMILTADVSSPDEMRRAIARARAQFGRIAGVYHTAGTLADGLMLLKSDEAALGVLRPKVHGTLVLHDALAADPPDYMMLFSSISAILGLEGQADYVAANSFLDAFAHQQAEGVTRVVSVNWGAWQGVGLAVKASNVRHGAQHQWQVGPSLLLERQRYGQSGSRIYGTSFSRDRHWVIAEHQTRDEEALLPGTGYLALAESAVSAFQRDQAVEISKVYFNAPFVVPAGEARDMELTVQPIATGYEWSARSSTGNHAVGKARVVAINTDVRVDIDAVIKRCGRHRRNRGGVLDQSFMSFGPRWACLQDQYFGDGEAILSLQLAPEFADDVAALRLHPAVLDIATGGAQELIPTFDSARDFFVPFSYGRVLVLDRIPARAWSHVRLAGGSAAGLALFDVTITDEQGRVVVDINDFCMKRVTGAQLTDAMIAETVEVSADALDSSASLAENMLRLGMRPVEGIEAMERILASPASPQVVVSSVDLAVWQRALDQQIDSATLATSLQGAPAESGLPVGEGDVEDRLVAIWREILGVQQLGMHDNFFELGGHSLLAVRLLTRVEKAFQRTISVADVFGAPTIAGIAAAIRAGRADSESEPELLPIARDSLRASRRQLTQ